MLNCNHNKARLKKKKNVSQHLVSSSGDGGSSVMIETETVGRRVNNGDDMTAGENNTVDHKLLFSRVAPQLLIDTSQTNHTPHAEGAYGTATAKIARPTLAGPTLLSKPEEVVSSWPLIIDPVSALQQIKVKEGFISSADDASPPPSFASGDESATPLANQTLHDHAPTLTVRTVHTNISPTISARSSSFDKPVNRPHQARVRSQSSSNTLTKSSSPLNGGRGQSAVSISGAASLSSHNSGPEPGSSGANTPDISSSMDENTHSPVLGLSTPALNASSSVNVEGVLPPNLSGQIRNTLITHDSAGHQHAASSIDSGCTLGPESVASFESSRCDGGGNSNLSSPRQGNGKDSSNATNYPISQRLNSESFDHAPQPGVPEDNFIRYFVKGEDPSGARGGGEDSADPLQDSPVQFWDFIKTELGMDQDDQGFSSKNASVEDDMFNFLRVPLEIEKVIFFGFFISADSLLFILVFLPLRILYGLVLLLLSPFNLPKQWGLSFQRTQLYDLLRGLIVFIAFQMLLETPMSRIYHYVRGQAFMKLYVIFNMLDIFDRLVLSFGQDILDSLFYTTKTTPRAFFKIFFRLVLGVLYVCLHALLYFVRLITLNVAINSTSNALVTLLVSNNFVELKGTVFKRSAEQNLFQLTCADIVERFELFVFLMLTALQNMESFTDFFFGTVIYIIASEFLVDWIKHAFVTKFNRVSYETYRDQMEALCRDLAPVGMHKHPYATSQRLNSDRPVDPTQAVAQKLGLATLPLSCVVGRFVWFNVPKRLCGDPWAPVNVLTVVLVMLCLIAIKSLLNVVLKGYACKVLMHRERNILSRSTPRLATLPATATEKELQKAVVAKHMQKISNLAGVRRYMFVHKAQKT